MSSFTIPLTYPVPASGPVYGAPQGMLYEELSVATAIDKSILSDATEQVTYTS